MTDVPAPAESLDAGARLAPEPAQDERAPSALRTRLELGMLIAYVVLLGLGVIAEAFHIQWILDWPIY